jgi:hypothetical protein
MIVTDYQAFSAADHHSKKASRECTASVGTCRGAGRWNVFATLTLLDTTPTMRPTLSRSGIRRALLFTPTGW